MVRKLVERSLSFIQEEFILLIGQNFLFGSAPTWTRLSQPEEAVSLFRRNISKSLGYRVWNCLSDKQPTFKQLQLWKPESLLYKWTFYHTYSMSYCGRHVVLTVWNELAKEQGVTAFYTDRMSIHCRYSAFCINLIYIIGRTDLINFRCLAILLAQQAVRYVKQSKQSALISGNVACCCWDISLIELSKHSYCSNCSNIH
jgi:hypothetical protein